MPRGYGREQATMLHVERMWKRVGVWEHSAVGICARTAVAGLVWKKIIES